MDFNAWVNIPLDGGSYTYLSGPVYRIWKAVTSMLNGAMVGKVTIVDCSAGTAGASPPFSDAGWTSDASPPNGAWLVLEFQNTWSTGEKMQVFVGYRSTTGNLAGFGSVGTNGYFAISPTGGWTHANLFFGASGGYWANRLNGTCDGASSSTLVFSLFFTPGINGTRPGAVCFAARNGGVSEQYTSMYAGALVAPAGCADAKYRVAAFCRRASCSSEGQYFWYNANGGSSSVCAKTTLDGWYVATIYPIGPGHTAIDGSRTGGYVQDISGAWITLPIPAFCLTVSRTMGYLQGMAMSSRLGDSTVSTDGKWFWWYGIGWPREAARDGAWV
jgi:hypothetical protein